MTFPILAGIPFPNVPAVPGVPALLRQVGAALPLPVLAVADALGLGSLFQPQWGLYLGGTPVLTAQSVVAVAYQKDVRVSNYPIEEGAFASYNKVQMPFVGKVTYTVGGAFSPNIGAALGATSILSAIGDLTGASAASTFLAAVDAAANSLQLYDLVTPEMTYANVNVTHYDYQRSARNGATMLTVDVWVEEIRQAPAPAFSSTQSPNGSNPSSGGTVQTVPVTSESLPAPV